MKKSVCAVFFVCLTCLLLCLTAHAAVLGDVDGSGDVTAADARLALRAAVALEPEILPGTDAFTAADADYSGDITSSDARSILRAAVLLEDLADRLPESEALSEEELEKKIKASMLYSFVEHQNTTQGSYGFVIGDNGTVVVPYKMIHKATAINFPYNDCHVESVLAADSESGLALLKVDGEFPYLSVNRTWFNIGDSVYALDSSFDLLRLIITDPPSDLAAEMPANMICAQVPTWKYEAMLSYRLVVDRFGRAIGLILYEEYTEGDNRFIFIMPLSRLPGPEEYDPRSAEEFFRDEWRITLISPVENVVMVQYGTGIIPLYAGNRNSEWIEIIKPEGVWIDISLDEDERENPILIIRASELYENVPIRIRVHGRYETPEIKLNLSIRQDGYVNMVGAEFLPDPGVIWETESIKVGIDHGKSFSLEYYKSATDLSDEELFYSYAYYLEEMGYVFKSEESIKSWNSSYYVFRHEEFGVTVIYSEWKDYLITVQCKIDD